MARKSNLVPNSTRSVEKSKVLCRKDIKVYSDYLVVYFKWTKTIQLGNRILKIPLVAIPDSIFCPVRAYDRMCKLNPISIDSPAFSVCSKRSSVPITYNQLQNKLKQLIRELGINPNLFSSHSFRRGGATLASKSGVPPNLIQLMGDWKSDAYKQYVVHELSEKIKVAKHVRNFVLNH